MTLALVVIDHSSVRWIIANKNRVAIGPPAAAFNSLLHRARRNESDFLRQKIWGESAQRRDIVDDPDPATMRCQGKIVFTRLNCQIANGNSRKVIALELCPIFSPIDRDPKSELGPEKEEVWFDHVFLDYVSVSTNAFDVLCAHERRPRFSIIGRFENIRRHVAKGVAVERRVGGTGVEVAGLDPIHP